LDLSHDQQQTYDSVEDYEIQTLTEILPINIKETLLSIVDLPSLLEVVIDIGKVPQARFTTGTNSLGNREVTLEDINYIIQRIGNFGEDNRAGIERTLHRISAIRNRSNKIIGLTLRVGRAVFGTIKIIEDLILTGKSTLLLGRPGIGKTTMLREVARVLADTAYKRVVIVDTSNEIAGDGDIPHSSIGNARRMQVSTPLNQHSVMIEAVENHMPEVIVIDEIGTELEADAARTIAERGVQLVATAHGNTLENLIRNPTLSDLIGGIHTVTLGDDEARRRRTQKTVLERRSPPTFDVLIEIQGRNLVAVHEDVASTVDKILRGSIFEPDIRSLDESGNILINNTSTKALLPNNDSKEKYININQVYEPEVNVRTTKIMPYGINKGRLQRAISDSNSKIDLVSDIKNADLLLTTKNYYRRRTKALREAENKGRPVYVVRRNTYQQIEQFIKAISRQNGFNTSTPTITTALEEAEKAVSEVQEGKKEIELTPQGAYIRHLQHAIADRYGISSTSTGRDPKRKVIIYK